jgi:SAM-dependent methyltransferase
MTGSFKDHFSSQAEAYERYRPGYPPELFRFLASIVPSRERALDVATGNGQAAVELGEWFGSVRATEPSQDQLSRARPHPRVEYAREPAEQVGSPDSHFDLVTAAQAAHWFEWQRFYPEVRRVLRPGGVLAVWTYEKFRAGGDVDRIVDDFYRDVVGPYWPRERSHVEEAYRRLPFPFEEIDAPLFSLVTHWSAGTALRYLGTWSAVQRYRDLRGEDPLALVAQPLRDAWGRGERALSWPIHLRAGRRP